ncbi:MAG: hypothetical protein JSR77_07290 [Planctomycetes bacterium]|nr:hypothetical protein [Planctomycetota bacterium]
MLRTRIAWTIWALLPILGLAYHFGPGQRAFMEDRAARLLAAAIHKQDAAIKAQESAYAVHLKAIDARRAAFLSQSTADVTNSQEIGKQEDAAYKEAASAWEATADAFGQAQEVLKSAESKSLNYARWAHSRALIRGGRLGSGVNELEELIEELASKGQATTQLARDARSELATGYYYGARLMRLADKPAQEWREVSGKARQNYRYLAETALAKGESDSTVKEYQNNLELVLNLEQSSLADLQAKPLPKNSPRGMKEGIGPPKAGKSKRPPRKGDARDGASGVGEIDGGW